MSDNIVPFTPKPKEPKERLILVCRDCNCQSFWHYDNGEVECCNCDKLMNTQSGVWRRDLANTPDDIEGIEHNSGTVSVKAYGDMELAKKSVVSKIDKWRKDGVLALVVAYHTNGEGTSWMNPADEDQKGWLVRKIEMILQNIRNYNVNKGQNKENDNGA